MVSVRVGAALQLLACGVAPSATTSIGDTSSTGDTTGNISGSDDAPNDASSSPASAPGSSDGSSEVGDAVDPVPPWMLGLPIPPDEPVPGDAAAGYWALLNEGYVSCGIPYALFPLAQAALGSFAAGEPLPGRTGDNANVPYNWTVHTTGSGARIASLNCLECHAGSFDGELIVGLGKADADYTSNFGELLAGVPLPEIPIAGIEELTRFMQRYAVLGPAIQMKTIGTNPADEVAGILAAHRDPLTLEWLDEPHTPIPDIVLPVDTPPWWRTKKKHGLFYNGMARGDHRGTMMFASSLCTDSVEEAASILTYFNNVQAFIESVEAPAYPFAIDQELAAQGAAVFASTCAGCHGTYAADEADESYPNLLFEIDVIGTDPLMAGSVAVSGLTQWFNVSPYGATTMLVPDDPGIGYVAPPLDGVWATAPFLHNGSVPTLELLLDSTARPRRWRRIDYDSRNFDQDAVGWPWVEIEVAWDDAPQDERRHIYDTTLAGHANTGHDFGDALSDAERRAVIEYVKTL